jgi:tetratricopeptide (TPR) repeat protein
MSEARKRRRRVERPVKAPSPDERPPRVSERTLWICLVLALATLGVYARVWTHEFIGLDDFNYIVKNPRVADGLTASGVAWAFTTGHEGNWHPLTWLSHMLDAQLFGLNPGPHHLVNVLLHIASTLLLFGVLQRVTGHAWRSAVVAGLFALHPLHVESVAWAAERKDVLSTLFGMLTLWAYVTYARQPSLARYLAALGLFAAGLLAKPMLVTLPFVLLLLDFWPLNRASGRTDVGAGAGSSALVDRRAALRLVVEKVPFLALTVIASVVTFLVQQRAGAVAELQTYPMGHRVANALVSYVAYLGKTFWPTALAILYPYPPSLPVWWTIGSLALLVGVSGAAILWARRYPYLPVGWFWYLGMLVPVIGLVQVGSQAMADRYTYVPLVGVFIVLTWGAHDLLARWRYRHVALPAAAALALLACAIVAGIQVVYWKNTTSVWTRAIAVTRDNFLVHYHLGAHFVQNGQSRDALPHYVEALRINPAFMAARNNLGITLANLGRLDEAIGHYAELIRLHPTYAEARSNLASALAAQGRTDEAIRELQEALKIAPGDAAAHFNLAALYRRTGRLTDATHHYSEGLRSRPTYADGYYRLGLVLAEQGRVEDAVRQMETAVRLEPGLQRARRALDELRARRGPR